MKFLIHFLTVAAALAAEAEVDPSGSSKVELHKPVGEDGEGMYTASTKGCFDVINAATPLVLESIDRIVVGLPDDRPFVVADYGTADAGTSLGLMSKITEAARSRKPDLEISLQYEDQKDNEWKSVFNHALGYKTVTDAYGVELSSPYKGGTNGVFVSACGVSFHEQAYPTGTVDFGMSFTAMHWLSSAPQGLVGRDELQAANCDNRDDSCGSAESQQGAGDFTKIIAARAKELKKGGRMVIVNFSKSSEGHYLGVTERGVSMWDSFKLSWDRLAGEGLISEAERLAISFPSYYRSMKEVEEGAKAVDGIKVVNVEEKVVRCPYNEAWVNGESQKAGRSARQHAEWFVPTTRTWSESTFKNALNDTRDKDAVMKKFWSNYVDLVEADPSVHHMDYVHSYLVLERE